MTGLSRISTFLFSAVLFPAYLFAQDQGSNDAFAEILRSTNQQVSEETIAEIVKIRNRIGSRLDLDMENTLWNLDDHHSNVQLSDLVNSESRSEKIFAGMVECTESVAVSLVSDLRQITRKMDDIAADLEELQLYEDADVIRHRASIIRNNARNAQTPSEPILR